MKVGIYIKYINIDDYLSDDIAKVETQIEEYNAYFDSVVKDCLPKMLIEDYFKYNGFHDWNLMSIQCFESYSSDESTLEIMLYDKWEKLEKKLIYSDVEVMFSNFVKNHFSMNDPYDIDEFLKLDDGMFSHEVIFPSGSSYYVEFKDIRIE